MSSTSGKIFATKLLQLHLGLYVCSDDNIYVADYWEGVCESTDGGITWSFVFQLIDGWHSIEIVKVETDQNDDFWTIARRDDNFQLHVYSVHKIHHHANITWRKTAVNPSAKFYLNLSVCLAKKLNGVKQAVLDLRNQMKKLVS